MWRSYLIAYPFLIVYLPLAALLTVPIYWLTGSVRPTYLAAQNGIRFTFALAGLRVLVEGLEHVPAGGTYVYVCNHVSNIDPAALFWRLPERIAFVLKDSLGKIPFLGYVMKMGGFVYVRRGDSESRHRAVGDAVDRLRDGISIAIFPEGTRSRDGSLGPFRPGSFRIALEAGVPVVPITVHGARELMPRGRVGIRPGTVHLRVAAPIAPAETSDTEGRRKLLEDVRAVMIRQLGGAASAES